MIDGKKISLSPAQQRVFDFIAEHGSITTLQSCRDLGETRLSARIFELKEKGVNVSYEWEAVSNRHKEKRRVKRYFIG